MLLVVYPDISLDIIECDNCESDPISLSSVEITADLQIDRCTPFSFALEVNSKSP